MYEELVKQKFSVGDMMECEKLMKSQKVIKEERKMSPPKMRVVQSQKTLIVQKDEPSSEYSALGLKRRQVTGNMFKMPTTNSIAQRRRRILCGDSGSKERGNKLFSRKFGAQNIPFSFGCSDSMSEMPKMGNLCKTLQTSVSKGKGMKMKRIEKLMSHSSTKKSKIPDLFAEDEQSMTLSQCFTY